MKNLFFAQLTVNFTDYGIKYTCNYTYLIYADTAQSARNIIRDRFFVEDEIIYDRFMVIEDSFPYVNDIVACVVSNVRECE